MVKYAIFDTFNIHPSNGYCLTEKRRDFRLCFMAISTMIIVE